MSLTFEVKMVDPDSIRVGNTFRGENGERFQVTEIKNNLITLVPVGDMSLNDLNFPAPNPALKISLIEEEEDTQESVLNLQEELGDDA